MQYDVIVLGAGPAGLTAAIYTTRYGLSTCVVSNDIGGTTNYAIQIENYPGYSGSGAELMKLFYAQAKNFGAEFVMQEAKTIEKRSEGNVDVFVVKTNKQEIKGKAIIIATGTERRKLGIKGEAEFTGRGVSYCATCDAAFFKNKNVAIVGGGNSAILAALVLLQYSKKLYIIDVEEQPRAEKVRLEKVKQNPKTQILSNSQVLGIIGKQNVQEIVVENINNKKSIKIPVHGVFIEAGSIPSQQTKEISSALGIKTNKEGYIVVDSEMKSSVPGVFAAGDITKNELKQTIVSASHGAIAAHSAYKYLRE